ncbi:MAG: hypothetical protein M1839_009519 [Geoglossum umbratile]|nr:MAG: hypothetical protein M1839_009519 [Geoglossum umbratile]
MHVSLANILAVAALAATQTQALGINCRGSGFCGKNGAVNTLAGYIDGIQGCRVYQNGEHIACKSDPKVLNGNGGECAFLQGTASGLSGSAIQALIKEIQGHGCEGCGSVPIGFPQVFGGSNDPSGGILTVNYVADTDNPCPDGTSYEATRQREYAVLRDNDGDPVGCRTTVTDAKGVKIRYSTDGLERAGDTPTKQRSTRSFEYDDWGQMCRVTQGSGVVTYALADPISLTGVEGIEGEGKSKTQFDVSGLPTQRALLRKYGSLASKEEYTYDGLGRLIKQTDPSGHTKQLSYDCFDRIAQTTWRDDHSTNTQYASQSAAALPTKLSVEDDSPFAEQAFDGFDRLVKKTIGSRTTKQSYQGTKLEPTEVTTPKGDKYRLTYSPALNYVLTNAASSDIAYTYQCDALTAAVKQFKDVNSTDDLQYLPSGMLSVDSITDGGKTSSARSIYSTAGRLESYTDVNGQEQKVQYDGFGGPQQLAQGKLKVAFSYDKACRLSESCAKDEENSSSLATRQKYDDFGREIERTAVQKGDSEKTLYQLSQAYDKLGLVSTRDVKDGEGNLLRYESFQYDSLNRLVDYQSKDSDSGLPADGKGNRHQRQQFAFNGYDSLTQVATVFQDGSKNAARYTYSNQDHAQVIKITNTHPGYSPQINRAYNANGCLIRDEQGRVLEYDAMNCLTAVWDASNGSQILSQYQYDAAGKLVRRMVPGQPDTRLSYRGDMLVAVTAGDSPVSYASLGNTYWGQTAITTTSTPSASSGQKSGQDASQNRELWTSDFHQSVLASLAAGEVLHQQYTLYGFGAARTSIGFGGQWRDPVTGWYTWATGIASTTRSRYASTPRIPGALLFPARPTRTRTVSGIRLISWIPAAT